ncbi:MAG: hypothetical protein IKT40_06265 [Bacilli bacterium]|nr:hypothetical protein [Bacilli bacterium]
MAIITNPKDYLKNVFKINSQFFSNLTILLETIENSVYLDTDVLISNNSEFLYDYTWETQIENAHNPAQVRCQFKSYNRNSFLNEFSASEIYEGTPSLNVTHSKNDYFSETDDVILYLGTKQNNGTVIEQKDVFSLYLHNLTYDTWTAFNAGVQKTFLNAASKNFWMGSIAPIGHGFQIQNPTFKNNIAYNYIRQSLPVINNKSNINLYQAVDDEITEQTNDVDYFIIDDLDSSVYHWFRVFNNKQMNQMFLLQGFKTYYETEEDLVNGMNEKIFELEKTPGEIPPGQEGNQINNQFGAGNFSSDVIPYPINAILGSGTGMTTYILNSEQLKHVLNKVWDPGIIEILTNFDLSPIVNALIWPQEMVTSREGAEEQTAGVYIGKTPIAFATLESTLGYYITNKYINVQDFGTLNLKSEDFYNSFMDFEPYTTAQIYLPYLGVVSIPMCDIIDHSIRINCCLDIATGAGKYLILIDNVTKYSYDCQIGVQIQLTNSNFSESLNGLIRNSVSQFNSAPSSVGSIVSAGVGNAASSLNSFDINSIGATGNNNERLGSQRAFIIFERVESAIPEGFNKNYGRPSMISSKLGDLKGFTTVPNVLLETTATEPEKQEIIKLLNEGVIII